MKRSSAGNYAKDDPYLRGIPKQERTTSKIKRKLNYKGETIEVKIYQDGKITYNSNDTERKGA